MIFRDAPNAPKIGDYIVHPQTGLKGAVARTVSDGCIVDLGDNRSCHVRWDEFKGQAWRHCQDGNDKVAQTQRPEFDYQSFIESKSVDLSQPTQTDDEGWLTKESIQFVAETLAVCDYELLVDLRKIWPDFVLKSASKQLDASTRQRIKEMVIRQNEAHDGI